MLLDGILLEIGDYGLILAGILDKSIKDSIQKKPTSSVNVKVRSATIDMFQCNNMFDSVTCLNSRPPKNPRVCTHVAVRKQINDEQENLGCQNHYNGGYC